VGKGVRNHFFSGRPLVDAKFLEAIERLVGKSLLPTKGGWAALKVMEGHLARNEFFVGDYSIADVALFAYTHVSHEGGFPLNDFPKIRAWFGWVKAQPKFIPMC
jgi:hypothetical protein